VIIASVADPQLEECPHHMRDNQRQVDGIDILWRKHGKKEIHCDCLRWSIQLFPWRQYRVAGVICHSATGHMTSHRKPQRLLGGRGSQWYTDFYRTLTEVSAQSELMDESGVIAHAC
jgi:hypothetical protein